MSLTGTGRPRPPRLAGLGIALLTIGSVQAACVPQRVELGIGALSSHWHEDDEAGARLLSERGRLRTVSAGAAGTCGALDWGLTLDSTSGRRDYQGRSTTGAGLSTHSELRSLHVQAELWWNGLAAPDMPAPGRIAWRWGARIGWEPDDRRDLQGVGAVLGYTEHRERWRLGLGLRARHALPASLGLDASGPFGPWFATWEGWVDTGPRARLRLDGAPFGEQTVRLREGRWESLGVGLTLRPAPSPGRWQPWLRWRWEGLHSRAGAPVAVSLPSGRLLAVSQPDYRLTQGQLMIGLSLDLP